MIEEPDNFGLSGNTGTRAKHNGKIQLLDHGLGQVSKTLPPPIGSTILTWNFGRQQSLLILEFFEVIKILAITF